MSRKEIWDLSDDFTMKLEPAVDKIHELAHELGIPLIVIAQYKSDERESFVHWVSMPMKDRSITDLMVTVMWMLKHKPVGRLAIKTVAEYMRNPFRNLFGGKHD